MNFAGDLNWNGDWVPAEILRLQGLGLTAAASHFTTRLKEALSIPVPRSKGPNATSVLSTRQTRNWITYRTSGGKYVYVEPATKGVAPRKFEGRLRKGQTYEVAADKSMARIGTNVKYSRRHEMGAHPYMKPTLDRIKTELETILGETRGITGPQSSAP